MRALVEELVGAQTVAEIVEAPGLALGGGTADDRILIDEYLDRAQIATK